MGIDDALMAKRIAPLLERNRIEWKKVTSAEALAVVGRGWKPDGGGGTSGGITALKELTEKTSLLDGTFGRKRVNKKLGIDHESLQLSAEDIMPRRIHSQLALGNGTTDTSTVWKTDTCGA